MKRTIIAALLVLSSIISYAQSYTLSGKILKKGTEDPIDFATIVLKERELWSVANENGEFILKNVPKGKATVEISCLGYVITTTEIEVIANNNKLVFYMSEDNLTLESAVVTAREMSSSSTTNRTIDRVALEHMQITNITDISSLLPGGATAHSSSLTGSEEKFQIRSNETASTFGTAIEVDGMRLSNNANFESASGASTRTLSSSNVESVEVIAGVPSVEYGDMSNGVVKVITKRGKSPFIFTASTNPYTKQISLSKGLDLGKKAGVINANIERANSISNLASPYTTYQRNALSLTYSNTLGASSGQPLKLSFGVFGNLGGYDSEADPDAFKETYTKTKDNNIRGNLSINWLLNKPWITNIELTASASYANNATTINSNKSSSSSTIALHGMEKGYFVAQEYDVDPNAEITLIPAGYWYEKAITESIPLDYNAHLKINWSHDFGKIINKIKIGAQYSGSGNLGRGLYYDDMSLAPTYRPYPYNEVPFMNNVSVYAEESATIPLGSTLLNLVAGVRSEWTMIEGSSYGIVNSTSPRFNAKYTILQYKKERAIQELSLRGSWGIAVKLPSFSILYPTPTYSDKNVFAAGTTGDGSSYTAYYIDPITYNTNPNLRWQRTQQAEVGVDMKLKWVDFSLVAYQSITNDCFELQRTYTPFNYNYTDIRGLDNCIIPSTDRIYNIDRETGIVTISDKTGVQDDVVVDYITRKTFRSEYMTTNDPAPQLRRGLEWVLDFGQIKAIKTSIRLDGNYYYYRSHSELLLSSCPTESKIPDPNDNSKMIYFPYVGWYVGSTSSSNGSISQSLRTNVTFTTHIPKVRMIVSLRIEGTLYQYSQYTSSYSEGRLTYPISETSTDYIPESEDDVIGKQGYAVTFPLYYSTYDDINTMIPFLEKYKWAKTNDPSLFSALNQLVSRSNTNYYFTPNKISPIFSMNISVTKEIKDYASISFYANNFINNTSSYRSTWTTSASSLFGSGYIPRFTYGLTLRFKF